MEAQEYVIAIRECGWTQARISSRTGISQPTLSKIESGDVADVMSRTYLALQKLHKEIVGDGAGLNGAKEK
jgi:transcriptional regulator with XRE-family HTH domain